MTSNRFWQLLVVPIAIAAIWCTGDALYKLYHYYRLSASTSATITGGSVEKVSEDRFLLKLTYNFSVKGELYSGETVFDEPLFRNAWAAEEALPKFTVKPWKAWYSSSNHGYSSLQKNFPVKECLSSIMLLGIMVYFLGLRYYVAKTF